MPVRYAPPRGSISPGRLIRSIALGFLVLASAVGAAEAPDPPEKSPAPAPEGGIFVAGGTRATGLEIVRLLRERGEPVTVLARPSSDTSAVEATGATVIKGDALVADEVRAALTAGHFQAVISTLGASKGDAPPPDYSGNRNLIDAAKAAGVERFVLITAIGVGNSEGAPPSISRWMLKDVIERKNEAEQYLIASGLSYTIIRPGSLLDKPPSGKAVLAQDPTTFSWISRADLARLVVDALYDRTTVNRTFSAFDPTREHFWSRWTQ
jgi:uncharacterized protein YbjT (DUF2867 family)